MTTGSASADAPSAATKSILLVVENLPVPYDRRVWQQALALKAANYQVSVVSPATRRYPKLAEHLEGIHVYRYPMLIEGKGYLGLIAEYVWSFICIFFWTLFVSLRRGFKVIMMANPPDIYFPIMWLWRLLGKKTVFDHHDLTPELFATKFNLNRSVVLSFFYFAERRMLRAVHKVVSTNESYKAVDMQRGGRAAEDIVVVRNAPDPARFTVRSPDPALRKSARYLVAFLGEIGQQDGVDVLIRAISVINARLGANSVQYVLMGAGPHFDNIVAYAKSRGVSGQITFTGRADNDTICRVLSTADLAVDPCPYSPHANVSTATKIMEYMFFSLPVVAFDLLETRRSGEEAICYARRGDEAHFGELIVELLRDEERRHSLGHAARIRLDSALSWRVSTRNLVTLMDDLIGRDSAPVHDPLGLDKVRLSKRQE
ncbi:MAG TPA: glycosyltransferase family 4 protein [Steroidobacteraceae bacterium]|nr:glycosyltransferase family 4 protein [Steroidobacteraceae bacterium]